MTYELFYFIVHSNGVIIKRENGASFESNAPLMFRHTRVSTLWELKQLILSYFDAEGSREIGNLAYRFPTINAENRLKYRASWISEDNHVQITFEVHKRVMQQSFMKFFAEVYEIGCSNGFRAFVPPLTPTSIHVVASENVAMGEYISMDDSDYDESSSNNIEEYRVVPNTTIRDAGLVFPTPLPILILKRY
ncbi:hypothetical protein PIB30_016756 [Stylosanthes scabra]|uniref:Uncharacterized protein n=1 Tax=Stylosanthes scabra TaxID=79078 RepID=A0ABU6Q7C5_9FABA|nr:hypothetical protein [Stylosanthes scabra]